MENKPPLGAAGFEVLRLLKRPPDGVEELGVEKSPPEGALVLGLEKSPPAGWFCVLFRPPNNEEMIEVG